MNMYKKIIERNIRDELERFKNSRVLILGIGGLGSNIAVSLARSGVGYMKLVDFDIVELSNLNRQYYTMKHIGMRKTDALKSLINEINPYIKIDVENIKVDEDNIGNIIKDFDIVCEAFDDAEMKSMLANKILEDYPNKYLIMGSGMAGIGDSNEIKTRNKMKRIYICGDETSDFKEVDGMMSPRVNICAGHQANLILRIIMGLEEKNDKEFRTKNINNEIRKNDKEIMEKINSEIRRK